MNTVIKNIFYSQATSSSNNSLPMQTTENPYQSPQTFDPPLALQESPAEILRRAHLDTEASIKSIGILYYLGAILIGMMGLAAVFREMVHFGILCSLFAAALWLTGFAVRKLQRWSRIVVAIFSTIGLIGFPIGTVICGYFLYLIFGERGRMVFSPRYKEVLAETPHIKYKTSIGVWIILAIIGAVLLLVLLKSISS